MADTFVKIATVTVGSGGAGTIDFTSIPSTYTDLCIKVSTRSTYAGNNILGGLRFNGSSASVYSDRSLYYVVGGASSNSNSANSFTYTIYSTGSTATANTFANNEVYVPNYAGSSNKSLSSDNTGENNATDAALGLTAGLWASTAAITSITLYPGAGSNFAQYSTATLYGISNS